MGMQVGKNTMATDRNHTEMHYAMCAVWLLWGRLEVCRSRFSAVTAENQFPPMMLLASALLGQCDSVGQEYV